MIDEITYLENIRNSLLHLQNLPLVLCVNNDKLCRKAHLGTLPKCICTNCLKCGYSSGYPADRLIIVKLSISI